MLKAIYSYKVNHVFHLSHMFIKKKYFNKINFNRIRLKQEFYHEMSINFRILNIST